MAMNLGFILTRSALSRPHHPAIIHGERVLTYKMFNERVNRLASAMRNMGLKPNDRVGLFSPNKPELLESMFAIWKAGFTAVPMNFRLHPKEVEYILNDSQTRVLIFAEEFSKSIGGIAPHLTTTDRFICIGGKPDFGSDRTRSYEQILADGNPSEYVAEVTGDDVAWLFYTSGTTGKPKGAMLTHRNVTLAVLNMFADIYPYDMDDVALHAAPLTHGSGFGALSVIAKGATNVILEASSFDPELVFAAIEKHRITVLPFLAPTMVKRLVDSESIDRYDLNSLRCIIYGGAPMYVEDLVKGLKRFGNIFSQVYGQGESPMTISGLGLAEHDINDRDRLASAGRARLGVQFRIQDDKGRELPPGEVGEIAVRGDTLMKGYWNNPEATAETIRDGWLRTGDVGYVDEQGFLYILDRSKDMIISGGNNIYPREVEEVLLRHPAVSEVCVFGVPDPEWGESVKAVVVPKPGHEVSAEELIAFCREHLASYKKPKSVDFVSELPKNNYGKILKRDLRDRYWKDSIRKV